MQYTCDLKSRMSQVRENAISLRKLQAMYIQTMEIISIH